MITIGLRVYSNKKIFYCIVEKCSNGSINYLDVSAIIIPRAMIWPEALAYTRNTILDLLNMYKAENAIIRISEFGVRYNDTIVERCYIEGILQETIASSPVKKFLVGQISEFCPLLEIQRDEFKKLANAEQLYENIPDEFDWNSFSLEERESILTANAAFKL